MKKIELASDAQSHNRTYWKFGFIWVKRAFGLQTALLFRSNKKLIRSLFSQRWGVAVMSCRKVCVVLVVGDYLIFYQNQEEKITVLRVLHGSRDFTELFSLNEDNDENG